MGEVLLATDTRLNRKVAIKRMLASSDPIGAVDPLDTSGQIGEESTG